MSKLVIVESPTKKKTIQKYLGEGFKVEASVGHIRDLAMDGKYSLGVDIENGLFTPHYTILPGKEKVIEKLSKAVKAADEVYLASDPDREGEAIAWHLKETLNLEEGKYKRLEFHEITRHAIKDSLENVRDINYARVDAQETRRIIDRILGFRVSFVLQRDTGAPSAGRVQSATLKLVYDRAKEQENFVPVTTYFLQLKVKDSSKHELVLDLVDEENNKIKFTSEEEVKEFINKNLISLEFIKEEVIEKFTNSKAPFTLSELYQTANAVLHYPTSKILAYAKKLFELGYITYPRTDSHRLAPEFINKTKKLIEEKFGSEYVGVAKGQNGNKGQDAHEALRPTDLSYLGDDLETGEKKIYKLIYNRTVESMMQAKKELVHSFEFKMGEFKFLGNNNEVVFKGFTALEGKEEKNITLSFVEGKKYKGKESIISETTKAPADYSEGSLVRKMEETGIGRPSTYATTVSTLEARGYVEVEKGFLKISESGIMVCEYLMKHFPNTLVNIEYTSDMEADLDKIEEETTDKLTVLTDSNNSFLGEFDNIVKNPEQVLLKTGEKCPKCGGDLIVKFGQMGKFIGCSNYPTCKYIAPEYVGRNCPDCGSPLVYKKSSKGKFIACSNFPTCKHTEFIKTFKKSK